MTESTSDATSLANADTLAWLLNEENPAVRYLTLTGLCGVAESGPKIV